MSGLVMKVAGRSEAAAGSRTGRGQRGTGVGGGAGRPLHPLVAAAAAAAAVQAAAAAAAGGLSRLIAGTGAGGVAGVEL